MISFFRHFLIDSWLGRILAGVSFVAFAAWGVGDVIQNLGDDNTVAAKVGSRKVTTDELARALQQEMPQLAQQMGAPDAAHLPPFMQQQLAREVLGKQVSQAELLELGNTLGIVVPDASVRDEVFNMPYFKGANGQFDRTIFNSKLAQANMTEHRLLDLVRDDLAGKAVVDPISTSLRAPDVATKRVYAFETETRSIDLVHLDIANEPTPPAPDEATLRRFHANHPWLFRTSEFRHAKVVALSPETVAPLVKVTDEEMHKLYDEMSSRYHVPEERSVQLITAPSEARARAIATLWQGGADWAAVQAAAKDSAAVEFPDARPSTLPSAALEKLVFAAPVDQVQGPSQVDTGWVVLRVTKVTPPHDTSFDDAKDGLREQFVKARAPDMMNAQVRKLQDAIAGGGLDSIPSDVGAAAAAGSLDMRGMTKDGDPAPLPAQGALRDAIIAGVFTAKKGAPATLVQAPPPPDPKTGAPAQGASSPGWYAVSVDDITPSQDQPYDAVKDKVLAAWQDEARRHAADEKATALWLAAQDKGGVSAVAPAGTPVQKIMASRARPSDALPQDMAESVMRMPIGKSMMGQDRTGFVIATVTAVSHPDPASDSLGYGRVQDGMSDSLSSDLAAALASALESRVKPKIIQSGVQAALVGAGFSNDTTNGAGNAPGGGM